MRYVPPKNLTIAEISSETCGGSLAPGKYFSSVVEGKTQIHHNMECPKELHADGKYTVTFPSAMQSSINVKEKQGNTKSFSFHMEIYGLWRDWYQLVQAEIDAILQRTPGDATPDTLRSLLFTSLKERRPKLTDQQIEQALREEVTKGAVFSPVFFRQVATPLLMRQHIEADAEGNARMRFCVEQKRVYCDWLDAHPEMKYKIFGGIGIAETEWDAPTAKFMEDVFKHDTYKEEKHPLRGKKNYEKSPSIGFKLMASVPKDGKGTGKIVVSGGGEVLWTTIYDFAHNPTSMEPIKTLQQFEKLTYMKGDNKRAVNPKAAFRLFTTVMMCEPSIFWSGLTKIGSFKFCVTELSVWKKVPFGGGARTLAPQQLQARFFEARQAMANFGIDESTPAYQDDASDGAMTTTADNHDGGGEDGGGMKRLADGDHGKETEQADKPEDKKRKLGD